MRILLTGNKGYIGSVLEPMLQAEGHEVVGWDIKEGKDIEDLRGLQDFEVVINLAALASNPLGEAYPEQTYQTNHIEAFALAKRAKDAGVKRFIFPSGLSIYGRSETPYSKSKFLAESDLMRLIDKEFTVLVLRPGVVYGPSPAMRYDTIINHFVFTSEMVIKGDGTNLVPIIHIQDLCQTFIAALKADSGFYNIEDGYYPVKEIANMVKAYAPEKRGNTLHKPQIHLKEGINELIRYYGKNK